MNFISFTTADLDLFSAVSHDVNPLHMNEDYARRTPFGERVVFGILAALATVQYTPARTDAKLKHVALLFLNPTFLDVKYRVEVATTGNQDRVQVFDGRKRLLQAAFTYEETAPHQKPADRSRAYSAGPAVATRHVAADHSDVELTDGFQLQGRYMPPAGPLERFMHYWRLCERGLTEGDIIALAWTSYVVGMELPGKQAAYSRLDLSLFPLDANAVAPFTYHVKLSGKDPRFDLLQLKASLFSGETPLAEAQIWATMRAVSPTTSAGSLQKLLPRSDRLQGRVALVIGGSRGLGAAIVQTLALQGCTVLLNYARSHNEANAVRDSLLSGAGNIYLLPGDATNSIWCESMRLQIMKDHGGLDFLVCNASPPIRPLDFVNETMDRFYAFIDTSLRLVATPMAQFADLLKSRQGRYVLISSHYAQTAPVEFPHYVTAKCALEGLLRAVCAPNKPPYGILVRPPKLLTDQTNTAVGKRDAVLPEQIAALTVAALMDPPFTETVRVIDDFSGS